MRIAAALLAAAVLASAGPAHAVGLGPLAKAGLTDGPAKGFWLTLTNPYRQPHDFRVYAIAADAEGPVSGVAIQAASLRLAAGRSRRVLVTITDLAPGESRTVRVCAELAHHQGTIHARVCSKLGARRVAVGA